MKHLSNISSVIISAAIFTGLSATAFAQNALTLGDPTCGSSRETKRLTYTGEKAAFSVDIPAEYSGSVELSDGEPKEVDDGSTEWALFFGESETGYVSCAFHESEGGYVGEMSAWRQASEDGSLDLGIFSGIDLDGTEYSVVDLRLDYSEEDGSEVIIGEYPLDEESWLNISFSATPSVMDENREDITAMLGTFSRRAASDIEEQYFTIDRSWLQLSIMSNPFGGEYTLMKEWQEEDRRYIGYSSNFEDTYVVLQYAYGSENEIEELLAMAQEPKVIGDNACDYLGTLQAKSGQDIYVFSHYFYGSEYNEITYGAISCGASGHNVFINVSFDGEHNTEENKEKAFELFRSLIWNEPLDGLPENSSETVEQPVDGEEDSPDTGVELFPIAAPAAAAALFLTKKRN